MGKKFILIALITSVLSACAASATPVPSPAATMVLPSGGSETGATAEAGASTEATTAPIISTGVTAAGEVSARQSAELSFQVPGTVADVLIDEGAEVAEGDVLALLDLRELDLQVKQAEAQLAGAQAAYEQAIEGATPEEIAAARAQVAQAQAGLRQAQGSVTNADIAAAEAALQQALALQADIEAGPKTTDMQTAQAMVSQAQASLEVQRTNLSAAKTNAELQLGTAANMLRDAQKAYSDVYWYNVNLKRDLDRYGMEFPDSAREAEEQALRAVQNAEAQLEQAKLAVEAAKQNEIDGLRVAEANVATAQANMQKLVDGATADQRAAVQAQVAQARATLDKLKGDQRAGALQAAQAGVAGAQANLDRVQAGASDATIAGALAQVQAAEAGVEAAKLTRDKATLRAPFAGTVALINVDPGDQVSGAINQVAIQIVDVSELRIEVNISDTDISRVREGQVADVRVDAVPGQTFTGTVSYIAPTATIVGTVRTYLVRVVLDSQEGLRAGMSARVSIRL